MRFKFAVAALVAFLMGFFAAQAKADLSDLEHVGTLRILSYNIYGKREPDDKGCKERMLEIAKRITTANPPYDIVSLNEHYDPIINGFWSCPAEYLTDAIHKDPRYRDFGLIKKSKRHFPRASWDPLAADGANSVFSLHPIVKFDHLVFEETGTLPVTGFMRSSVRVSEKLTVDIWSTHLESKGSDDCSDRCRKVQYEHLFDYVSNYSGYYSIYPRPPYTVPIDGNAVIVMGDFNIGGPLSLAEKNKGGPYKGNAGYDEMLKYFGNARDLWIETNPNDPGYTYDCIDNNLIGCKYRERIDYMLVPTHWLYQPRTYTIKPEKMEIIKWKTKSGMDTSDHYGLDATIKFYKQEEVRYINVRLK